MLFILGKEGSSLLFNVILSMIYRVELVILVLDFEKCRLVGVCNEGGGVKNVVGG